MVINRCEFLIEYNGVKAEQTLKWEALFWYTDESKMSILKSSTVKHIFLDEKNVSHKFSTKLRNMTSLVLGERYKFLSAKSAYFYFHSWIPVLFSIS